MNKYWRHSLLLMALTGCAHESTITPSQGHIGSGQESQVATATPNSDIPKPLKKPAYVPPPKPKTKEQTYSVVVSDVPVREILFALARESKQNIDIHPGIQGSVTLNAVDQTLAAILDRLSKQVDLIYKAEGNVLTIMPDTPVLKTYQINYVNMDRDTKGSIGVSQQIASSATAGTGSAASSGGGSNTSSTTVDTISKNHYWDSLIQNIKDILAESDKEVLVSKSASDANLQNYYNSKTDVSARGKGSAGAAAGGAAGSGDQNVQGNSSGNSGQTTENNLKEYKMLYAASIIANRETGVLSVRATQKQHEKLQEFIDRVQAGAKRQVLIEATIVEIKLNDQYQSGVDWSRLGSDGTLKGFTFKQELLNNNLTGAPRFAIGYNNSLSKLGDLAASIRLLQTFGDTKVLSSPKLMVLNSQTAILKVVDELIYFTGSSTTVEAIGTSPAITRVTTTPHTMPVGMWMSVTPQINENGSVTLNVRPTISRVASTVQDPNPDLKVASRIPQVQVREMESVLQINSGNTVILGGLMQDEISKGSENVPFASNLPLIGKLFSAKNDNSTKTELVIFLRPTVIPNASIESDELKSFKQFLPEQQLSATTNEPAN